MCVKNLNFRLFSGIYLRGAGSVHPAENAITSWGEKCPVITYSILGAKLVGMSTAVHWRASWAGDGTGVQFSCSAVSVDNFNRLRTGELSFKCGCFVENIVVLHLRSFHRWVGIAHGDPQLCHTPGLPTSSCLQQGRLFTNLRVASLPDSHHVSSSEARGCLNTLSANFGCFLALPSSATHGMFSSCNTDPYTGPYATVANANFSTE